MVGILLMSHGRMAEGMLDSSKLFFGDDIPQIKALCLMASDNPEEFDEKIRAAVEEIDDGQGVIAMCDLLGGTPCNRSALVLNDRMQVITGMNFSILLELLGKRMSVNDISEIDIPELIQVGKDGIISLNEFFKAAQQEDSY
ncbi:MAG: PTS sugar transporter subunit IIA [Erysipelotrichaceae bacterium]|nr:PTS sugar transporter subunit IIA [Erysipelotrichaceae bacterium]MBQ2685658.1 PTS sugar transporter subunit IIA [Erysipelotrichaceae bacterium]MBR2599737.1 PTS sugar transporter subunit IIA [Erysipelotrichaceae bacterium]MBR2792236.1 PTS sugar transporter subunit IIA [Erysipelotrichaceae bacterium]MBR2826686.1 PTS sugar transporter subunit IIA [Erysipelotrichaceae bacterium]